MEVIAGFRIQDSGFRIQDSGFRIQDSGAPYSNEAGDFSGFIGSCLDVDVDVDVDDRLKLILNLQHSEARFRALFEQASVVMARVGTEGERLQVNQALSDITGYSKQELLKLTWQQITHLENLQEDVSFVELMLSGEIPSYSMEKRYIRKDGREIWVKITVAALIWDEDIRGDSDSKYFVSVIEDIDQQKRSEAALQKSEAKYRELFEGNQAIALLIDPSSGALIDCNRAAMKFYSYSREKLCSMSIWDISLSSKSKLKAYLRIQAQKGASQFFSRHRIATGEVKDVEVNAGLVVLDGRQLIYVIVHDISERRKIEQRLA